MGLAILARHYDEVFVVSGQVPRQRISLKFPARGDHDPTCPILSSSRSRRECHCAFQACNALLAQDTSLQTEIFFDDADYEQLAFDLDDDYRMARDHSAYPSDEVSEESIHGPAFDDSETYLQTAFQHWGWTAPDPGTAAAMYAYNGIGDDIDDDEWLSADSAS